MPLQTQLTQPTTFMSSKIGFPLYAIGYVTLIASTLVYIFAEWTPISFVFAIGAVCAIVGRYLILPEPSDFRIKRLNNMLGISAILIIATAYLMYLEENVWAITLTIAAFIDIFTTFRYPKNNG